MAEDSSNEVDVDEEVICEENEVNASDEKKSKSQVWKFFKKNGKKSAAFVTLVWHTMAAPAPCYNI